MTLLKGMNVWSLPAGLSLEEQFKLTKAAGFDTIELNLSEEKAADNIVTKDLALNDSGSLTLDITNEQLDAVKALSQKYALPVTTLFPCPLPNSKKFSPSRFTCWRVICCGRDWRVKSPISLLYSPVLYPIVCGNHSTICGKNVIASSNASSITKKSQPSFIISPMGIPVSALVTKSSIPNGG